jgi:hypothetical protein
MKRIALIGAVLVAALCGAGVNARAEQGAAVARLAQGKVSVLDLKSAAPIIKITKDNGTVLNLALDPKSVKVEQAGKTVALDQLKVGQKVKARYTTENGKQVISSLELE